MQLSKRRRGTGSASFICGAWRAYAPGRSGQYLGRFVSRAEAEDFLDERYPVPEEPERDDPGMTQAEVSLRLGLHVQTVRAIECGALRKLRANPDARALCEALGLRDGRAR
jgi:hypothetical protein